MHCPNVHLSVRNAVVEIWKVSSFFLHKYIFLINDHWLSALNHFGRPSIILRCFATYGCIHPCYLHTFLGAIVKKNLNILNAKLQKSLLSIISLYFLEHGQKKSSNILWIIQFLRRGVRELRRGKWVKNDFDIFFSFHRKI